MNNGFIIKPTDSERKRLQRAAFGMVNGDGWGRTDKNGRALNLYRLALMIGGNESLLISKYANDYSAGGNFAPLSYTYTMEFLRVAETSGWVSVINGRRLEIGGDGFAPMTQIIPSLAWYLTPIGRIVDAINLKDHLEIMGDETRRIEYLYQFRKYKLEKEKMQHDIMLRRIIGDTVIDGSGDFRRKYTLGGRIYAYSNRGQFLNYQQLSSDERKKLKIDGSHVVLLDFAACAPNILYAIAGEKLEGDAYEIEHADNDRELNKKLMMWFTAGKITPQLLFHSIRYRIGKMYNGVDVDAEEFETLDGFWVKPDAAKMDYLAAFCKRHSAVKRFIKGFKIKKRIPSILQNYESNCMMDILAECDAKGIECYPTHDELVCREDKAQDAISVMRSNFKKHFGRDIAVKMSSAA